MLQALKLSGFKGIDAIHRKLDIGKIYVLGYSRLTSVGILNVAGAFGNLGLTINKPIKLERSLIYSQIIAYGLLKKAADSPP